MSLRSQTSNRQLECGLRWTIAALLILGAIGSAHAQDKTSAQASLHISVTVMPVLQAEALAQSTRAAVEARSVAFNLQHVVLKQSREVRDKSSAVRIVGNPNAILETVTTVVE